MLDLIEQFSQRPSDDGNTLKPVITIRHRKLHAFIIQVQAVGKLRDGYPNLLLNRRRQLRCKTGQLFLQLRNGARIEHKQLRRHCIAQT